MKTRLIATLLFFAILVDSFAQFPVHVKEIKSVINKTVSIKGNLAIGAIMKDLSWAWKSYIACFPGTQKEKYTRNHLLYYTGLAPHTVMKIILEPNDKNVNLSLNAYPIGTTNYSTVPSLYSCVSCEADHKWDYPKKGRKQDHTRIVELNTIKNPYNAVIGVVGSKGLKKRGYTLNKTILF
jgi:hypothetical protein